MIDINLFYLSFSICLAILLSTILYAAKYAKGIFGWIRSLSVGVVLANIALLLPLPLLPSGNFAVSILSALQAGSLNAEYRAFLSLAEELIISGGDILFFTVYRYLLAALFVLSPFLLGGAAFTFFENVSMLFKYTIYERFKDVYYFSELNERSLMLAKSISSGRDCLIAFCNVSSENTLRGESTGCGYIVFEASEHGMKSYGRKNICFFEISGDALNNVNAAQRLIESFSSDTRKERIRIYIFAERPEAEIMMDSTDKAGLAVSIINAAETQAYSLMFDMPLYKALEKTGDDKLCVLVVGAGSLGLEMIKAAAWCGQMDGIPLEITAIDACAKSVESRFRLECPELLAPEYNIRFLAADVNACEFEKALEECGPNVNYIVLCLGQDDLNIATSLYLRGYYLRNSPDFSREPIICVHVSSEAKHKNLTELTAVSREKIIAKKWDFSSEKAQNYNLYPFGAYESVYSYKAIVDSAIERLAINVNAVYERTLDIGVDAPTILYNYYASEVGKRSSRANAVHIQYKLYALGYEMLRVDKETDTEDENSTGALNKLRAVLNDQRAIMRMAEIEHSRWNAFQRGQGFRAATVEQSEIYKAQTNGSHINRRAKLHACICPWESLPEVAKLYDRKMIEYDKELIRNIPLIIGAEGDQSLNLGGIYFRIVEKGEHR